MFVALDLNDKTGVSTLSIRDGEGYSKVVKEIVVVAEDGTALAGSHLEELLCDFFEDHGITEVMCSSSIDFPDEEGVDLPMWEIIGSALSHVAAQQ